MILLPLIIISTLLYVLILLLLLTGFLRTGGSKNADQPPVTVVVAAHNEENTIRACLDALVAQDYPAEKTQIIIIDDRSADSTANVIKHISQDQPRIELLQIENDTVTASPKKNALWKGIQKATGDIIITTDADCQPPPQWISHMVASFSKDTGIVAGLAPLKPASPFIGRLLSLDALFNMLVSGGGIGWGQGITCTGRNLAFRKSSFDDVSGYSSIQHSLSGDDDLLLQLISRHPSWKVQFCSTGRAAVFSQTKGSFREHFHQRTRHVSAARYYSPVHQGAFTIHGITSLLLIIFPILALYFDSALPAAVAGLVIKLVLDGAGFLLTGFGVKQIGYIILLPVWELWQFFNLLITNPLGLLLKPKWR